MHGGGVEVKYLFGAALLVLLSFARTRTLSAKRIVG